MTIPLKEFKKDVIEKVMEYCSHIRRNKLEPIPTPLPSANLVQLIDPWQLSFITDGVNRELLFDLALAANYLDI